MRTKVFFHKLVILVVEKSKTVSAQIFVTCIGANKKKDSTNTR